MVVSLRGDGDAFDRHAAEGEIGAAGFDLGTPPSVVNSSEHSQLSDPADNLPGARTAEGGAVSDIAGRRTAAQQAPDGARAVVDAVESELIRRALAALPERERAVWLRRLGVWAQALAAMSPRQRAAATRGIDEQLSLAAAGGPPRSDVTPPIREENYEAI